MHTLSSVTKSGRSNLVIDACMFDNGFCLFLKTLDHFLSVSAALWSQKISILTRNTCSSIEYLYNLEKPLNLFPFGLNASMYNFTSISTHSRVIQLKVSLYFEMHPVFKNICLHANKGKFLKYFRDLDACSIFYRKNFEFASFTKTRPLS